MPVCIGGMHRSGTSLVARLLNLGGLSLGPERDLMPPAPENPAGFWEHLGFVALNDAVLNGLGGGWDCPPPEPADWTAGPLASLVPTARTLLASFDGQEPWGWKDPRNSLTLPFWRAVAGDVRVVIVVRHPLEVALSLRRRNGFSFALGLTLWQIANERLLATAPLSSRIVSHFDAFDGDPAGETRRLLAFLGLPAGEDDVGRARAAIAGSMRQHRFASGQMAESGVSERVRDLYDRLCAEAEWSDDQRARPSRRTGTRRRPAPPPGPPAAIESGIGGTLPEAVEVAVLRQDVEALRLDLAIGAAALTERQARVDELEEAVRRHERDRTAHETRIDELEAALRQVEPSRLDPAVLVRIEELERALDGLGARAAVSEASVDDRQAEDRQRRDERAALDGQVADLEKALRRHEREREARQRRLAELDAAVATHEADRAARQARIAELEAATGQHDADRLAHETRLGELETAIGQHEQDRLAHEARVAELEQAIRRHEHDRTEREARISELETANQRRETERAGRETLIVDLEAALAQRETARAALDERIATADAALAAFDAERADCEPRLADLETAVARADSERRIGEIRLRELAAVLERQSAGQSASQVRIGELEAALRQAEEARGARDLRLVQLEGQLKREAGERLGRETRLAELVAAVERHRAERQTAEARLTEIDAILADLDGDRSAGEARLAELGALLARGEVEGAARAARLAALETTLGEREQERRQRQGRVAELEAAIRQFEIETVVRQARQEEIEALLGQHDADLVEYEARLEQLETGFLERRLGARERQLRTMLLDAHEQLRQRDAEFRALLGAALLPYAPAAPAAAQYRDLLARIRAEVAATLPPFMSVAVLDPRDDLGPGLDLAGRETVRFPPPDRVPPAGTSLDDPAGLVAAVESLHAGGNDFLLIPASAFGWLARYPGVRDHLARTYRLLVRREDTCLIFALNEPPPADAA